jgi:hypothetical protein
MNLTKEHMNKVLNDWAAYYVKLATIRSSRCEANLKEEQIRLRVAKAVEDDRNRRNQDDWSGGFGEPTTDQAFEETLKRATADAAEANRVLQNNLEMAEYIKLITS